MTCVIAAIPSAPLEPATKSRSPRAASPACSEPGACNSRQHRSVARRRRSEPPARPQAPCSPAQLPATPSSMNAAAPVPGDSSGPPPNPLAPLQRHLQVRVGNGGCGWRHADVRKRAAPAASSPSALAGGLVLRSCIACAGQHFGACSYRNSRPRPRASPAATPTEPWLVRTRAHSCALRLLAPTSAPPAGAPRQEHAARAVPVAGARSGGPHLCGPRLLPAGVRQPWAALG